MIPFARVYDHIRILSLDVVLGAIISGAMSVKILGVEMPKIWFWALPISVWVIYTADHLLDAYRLKDQAHTPRHLFHHQHFTWIGVVWSIFFLFCLIIVPLLSPRLLWIFGAIMGFIVLLHLGINHWVGNRIAWFVQKELGVAMIYAFGVWGAPLLFAGFPNSFSHNLLFLQFFLLALINLWVFSMYEMEIDQKDGSTSFARAVGKKWIKILIVFASIVILGIVIFFASEEKYLLVQFIYSLMLVILLLITFRPQYFQKNERYRIWGDGIFFLPLIYLIPF